MGRPAVTGKLQRISWPSPLVPGSQRSLLKMPIGVVAGTVGETCATVGHVAALLPVVRYRLGSVWSACQLGPASVAWIAGPPASTRYRTLVLVDVGTCPLMKTLAGSVTGAGSVTSSPPASGKYATRPR